MDSQPCKLEDEARRSTRALCATSVSGQGPRDLTHDIPVFSRRPSNGRGLKSPRFLVGPSPQSNFANSSRSHDSGPSRSRFQLIRSISHKHFSTPALTGIDNGRMDMGRRMIVCSLGPHRQNVKDFNFGRRELYPQSSVVDFSASS